MTLSLSEIVSFEKRLGSIGSPVIKANGRLNFEDNVGRSATFHCIAWHMYQEVIEATEFVEAVEVIEADKVSHSRKSLSM